MYINIFIGLMLLASTCARAGTIYLPPIGTYESGSYLPADRNIELLKDMAPSWKPLAITDVRAKIPGENHRFCRGSSPVYSLNKKPYEYVLADALARELNSAGLYGRSGSIPIAIELNTFDFATFGSGKWTIEATFTIGGEAPFTVTHEFPFSVGLSAAQACSNASFAQHRAIQGFLFTLYTNPQFRAYAQKEIPDATRSLSAP